jgi:hypothetical protein
MWGNWNFSRATQVVCYHWIKEPRLILCMYSAIRAVHLANNCKVKYMSLYTWSGVSLVKYLVIELLGRF